MVFPGPISRDIGAMRRVTFVWSVARSFASNDASGSEPSEGRPSDARPEIKKSRRFICPFLPEPLSGELKETQFPGENISHTALHIQRAFSRPKKYHSSANSNFQPGTLVPFQLDGQTRKRTFPRDRRNQEPNESIHLAGCRGGDESLFVRFKTKDDLLKQVGTALGQREAVALASPNELAVDCTSEFRPVPELTPRTNGGASMSRKSSRYLMAFLCCAAAISALIVGPFARAVPATSPQELVNAAYAAIGGDKLKTITLKARLEQFDPGESYSVSDPAKPD